MVKQWFCYVGVPLSAYLWGTAAGFDSLVCVKGVKLHLSACIPHLHAFQLCLVCEPSPSHIALSIYGPFPPFITDIFLFASGIERPTSSKM